MKTISIKVEAVKPSFYCCGNSSHWVLYMHIISGDYNFDLSHKSIS